MTTTAPAPLISRNPVFSTSLSLRLTLSSQLPLSFRLPLSFLLPLSFRAQREISPPLPLLPTVISSEARNLSRYPCCHCHFERSEKSFPLRLNPITSAHHVISSAARNLSLFSHPPPFPPQRVGSGARGPCRSHSRMLAVPCPCSREPRGCPRQFWRACPGRSPVPGLPAAPWIGVHPPPRPRGRGLTFHAIPATIAVRRHVESGRVLPGRRNAWAKVAIRPGRR